MRRLSEDVQESPDINLLPVKDVSRHHMLEEMYIFFITSINNFIAIILLLIHTNSLRFAYTGHLKPPVLLPYYSLPKTFADYLFMYVTICASIFLLEVFVRIIMLNKRLISHPIDIVDAVAVVTLFTALVTCTLLKPSVIISDATIFIGAVRYVRLPRILLGLTRNEGAHFKQALAIHKRNEEYCQEKVYMLLQRLEHYEQDSQIFSVVQKNGNAENDQNSDLTTPRSQRSIKAASNQRKETDALSIMARAFRELQPLHSQPKPKNQASHQNAAFVAESAVDFDDSACQNSHEMVPIIEQKSLLDGLYRPDRRSTKKTDAENSENTDDTLRIV